MNRFIRSVVPAALAAVGATAAHAADPAANAYVVTKLVSDLRGARTTDPNLKNAWGVAFSPAGSPFWIADNNSGKATLYDGAGMIVPLVVTIPPATAKGSGSPTGIVFNPSMAFLVPGTTFPANFIFATEDGTISAWSGQQKNPNLAVIAVNKGNAAVYKGLAFAVNVKGPFIFATNFRAGTVDVYDPTFKLATTAGGFKDPGIPAGYAPFGIQNINGNLIVTYAKQNSAKHDDVAGPGHGFVDVFDTDGHLLARLASRGRLNSPWGVARASFAFGLFSDDILIGNFGDSKINAVTPTGLVTLNGSNGKPLAVATGKALWNLGLGGGRNSSPSTLYFTAGINDEADGLFGTVTPARAPPSTGPY